MRSCPASHTTHWKPFPLPYTQPPITPACFLRSPEYLTPFLPVSSFKYVSFLFSFHHNVSLFSFLCPEGTPNTFSVSSALQLYFPSLSTQSLSQLWSFFSFHYLILVSAFIRFLLLINNFILGTTIQCCLATLSPWHHLSALSDCTFCIKSLPPLAPYLAINYAFPLSLYIYVLNVKQEKKINK